MKRKVVIVGAGAAGIFAAVRCAENAPHLEVVVLEKTRQPLAKVRISGGGRCNVTHAQFNPQELIKHYPRGRKELLGPFHQFQPQDTWAWFEQRGVDLKVEADGRVFPTSDHSASIVNCLLDEAKKWGVRIELETGVNRIALSQGRYVLDDTLECDALVLATGGSPQGFALAASLGHTLVPAVPSLFTFNVPTSALLDLSGISCADVELSLPELGYTERGVVLLTHFGFSGPAALKLSAFGARDLHACKYRTPLHIHWLPALTHAEIFETLRGLKKHRAQKYLESENPFHLPSNLWKRLLVLAQVPSSAPLGHISEKQLEALARNLSASVFLIEGKTTHKAEFVTAGGIELKEIDFKTMQSKLCARLFFAGEILNIDGVTGGFNFQNAWTTAAIAAQGVQRIFVDLSGLRIV